MKPRNTGVLYIFVPLATQKRSTCRKHMNGKPGKMAMLSKADDC